jgi:hypothetical protein
MCLPAAAVGIFSAVSSAVSSIGAYAAEQANYRAQMQAYRASEINYKRQIENNARAANRAYEGEQRKLDFAYSQAAQEAQNRMITALQQQGAILASGRQGQSVGLLMGDAERTAGRDIANLGMNLAYAQTDYFLGAENAFIEATSANNIAASQRMAKPSKPSPIGLIAGLGQAAIGGYSAFSSLKAPSAGSVLPSPSPGTAMRGFSMPSLLPTS